jgi:steroid delta-isomerase-like uncharacterized protein
VNTEPNKALVRRFYEAIERKDFAALTPMVHPDFVFYNQVDTPYKGLDGLIESEKKNFEAFETFVFPIVDIIAERDKVAVYMMFEGKGYRSNVFGIPANGRSLRMSLCMWLTLKDGKIIEKRAHFDVGDIRKQLTS